MATINNFKDTINKAEASLKDAIDGADFSETSDEGVSFANIGSATAFTSSTANINLSESSITTNNSLVDVSKPWGIPIPIEADSVILTGEANLNVTGDSEDNIIMGNDGDNTLDTGAGNDQVYTGNGDDSVILGGGDDTVTINGSGTKSVDGGSGNDTFIIKPSDDASDNSSTTFTGLNRGDSVKLHIADSNDDGELTFDDVNIDETSGSAVFKLPDGSSFTLQGVTNVKDGNINYNIIDNDDGTWDVELT